MNSIVKLSYRDSKSQGTSSEIPDPSQTSNTTPKDNNNKQCIQVPKGASRAESSLNEAEQLNKTQDTLANDLDVSNATDRIKPQKDGLVAQLEQERHPEENTSDLNPSQNTSENRNKGYLWGYWGVWGRTTKIEKEQECSSQTKNFVEGHKETTVNDNEIEPETEGNGALTHKSTKSTSFMPSKILMQSPTTVIVEETVASAEPEHELSAADSETEQSAADADANFIWDITRRVSRIAFLPLKAADPLNIEGLAPNKCSQVTDNDQNTVSSDTNRSISSDSQKINTRGDSKESSWWTPWKWEFPGNKTIEESASEISTGIIEDELLKVQRKEIANQIKCQSYGIPRSITWGILHQEDEDFGHVYITGNSYKKSIIMKNLPASAFELQELQLSQDTDNNKTSQSKVESLVLPDIEWNYRDLTLRTRCRIAMSKIPALQNLFAPQSHLYYDSQKKRKHSSKRVVKKAIVICFHGFLPQKIVKNIIGEGTFSSQKMTELATKELKRWADIHQVELTIESINLEGYGKLFERVNECLSILENWVENISNSDFILAVSNSHSVPLAIHVIARLITSGYLDKTEKLGFIGFSGICMGPIPEVESKISIRGNVGQDTDIISEILDLEDPDSLQSKELSRNMKVLIKKNFKVTFIGSLNDCFSPLYSSLGLHLLHPNIYRALYIDGSQHQPDFLTSLFNLILTVKNLNFSDHGLLIELSNFFTGQIGDGQHSKVLTNKYGYRIGINNMLNTSDLFYQKKVMEELTNVREYTTNSYHIPWCLRGFLEELQKLQKHFDAKQIIEQLYEEFKSWEPETQRMKDLRYCMLAFDSVMNEDLGL